MAEITDEREGESSEQAIARLLSYKAVVIAPRNSRPSQYLQKLTELAWPNCSRQIQFEPLSPLHIWIYYLKKNVSMECANAFRAALLKDGQFLYVARALAIVEFIELLSEHSDYMSMELDYHGLYDNHIADRHIGFLLMSFICAEIGPEATTAFFNFLRFFSREPTFNRYGRYEISNGRVVFRSGKEGVNRKRFNWIMSHGRVTNFLIP
ncbi:MAG: hypothetical protein LBF72_00710 [Holosporales bacterium]|nr:hypothetical protein [Holosporales bacterium]